MTEREKLQSWRIFLGSFKKRCTVKAGGFRRLKDLGLEPRIERGGLRATEARLAELEAQRQA